MKNGVLRILLSNAKIQHLKAECKPFLIYFDTKMTLLVIFSTCSHVPIKWKNVCKVTGFSWYPQIFDYLSSSVWKRKCGAKNLNSNNIIKLSWIFQSPKNAQLGRYFFATGLIKKSSCEKIFSQLGNFKPTFWAFFCSFWCHDFLTTYLLKSSKLYKFALL